MIDKSLMLIIFFYAAGLSIVGMQYTLGDTFNVQIVSPLTGKPVESAIVGYLQPDELNTRTTNIVSANFTTNSTFYDRVETFTTGAAYVAWELVALMSGTYIFYIMLLFGVPIWMVTMFVILYTLLLARSIVGWVRGI